MASAIGTAYVDVALDPKQIEGQIGGIGGKATGGFSKMGGVWGKAAATGFGAAIVGAVAAGKYLYDIGAQFDAMADTIRVSTGKSGKALDELVKTAKGVGTDVPTSFENAGQAVATLSTRLGVTGKPLRDLSDQVLELARLSGTDLTTALDSVTRMLGDAGLKGADASKGIDELWRASQASQVPVTRLADLLTKFGGPLRQLGFSFEEQAAMLAKFEKEGVNTELVMGSMRIALGKMAKAGKDPVIALRETMQAIKDTGDAGVANAKAIEVFGARAGPDMAAAIREGRFSVDDLLKTIKSGSDTVLKAGADTRDFTENWQIFKNQVAVGLAPLAAKLFQGMGDGMAFLNREAPPLIARLRNDLGPTIERIGKVAEDVGDIVRDLAPVWRFAFAVIENEVRTMLTVWKGLADVIQGTVRVIKALLEGDWRGAWNGAKQVVQGLATIVEAIMTGLLNHLKLLAGAFLTVATALGKAVVDGMLKGLAALAGVVTGAISGAANAAAAAATSLGAAVVAGLAAGLAGIGAAASSAIAGAKAAVTGAFAGAVGWLFGAGQDIIRGLGNGIRSMAGWAADQASGVVSSVKNKITGAFGIGSPSRWAIEQGKWVTVGLGKGLELGTQASVDAAKKLADKTMAAARAPLEAGVANLTAQLQRGFAAAQSAVMTPAEKALAALQARGVAAMSDAMTPAEKALKALEDRGVKQGDDSLTAAERQLAALQAAREEADRQRALADARAQQAQAETDAEQLAAARAVEEATYAITVAGLERQAELERAARDKAQADRQAEYDQQVAALQRQADVERAARETEQERRQADYDARVAALQKLAEEERTNLDARQFLQQQAFDRGLAALQGYLTSSQATAAGAKKKIEGFMKRWGVTTGDLGELLGKAFAKGVDSTTDEVSAAAERLKGIVEDALDFVRRAQREFAAAEKASGGKGKAAPAAAAAAPLFAAPTASAAPAGGTLYSTPTPFTMLRRAVARTSAAGREADPAPTIVRVYIGDQELRGIVRTEVGHADDETARISSAGAR